MLQRMMASNPDRRGRALGAALATAALLLAAVLVVAGSAAPAAAGKKGKKRQADSPPNVVLIVTDDQTTATVNPKVMPNLERLMVDPGTSFSDYIVTTPLCCPSRAAMLTGQYGHNNGVLVNDYAELRHKTNVLPVWLRGAGYQTAHVGKFLNRYGSYAEKKTDVAPGWKLWFTQFERKRYYDWKASKNGKRVEHGVRDKDYLTEVVNRVAARWAKRLSKQDAPFYMQLDYYAPHGAASRRGICEPGPEPAPRDVGYFADEPLPSPPSFNEEDVSDKPSFIRTRSLVAGTELEQTTNHYRCAIESLRSVDRGIARLFAQLERHGELDNTAFIFTSDNGYFFGEHRIGSGKEWPYEENLRVPLTILLPAALRGTGAPSQVDASVANIDIAPTILDLAGASPCKPSGACRTMDGRSLLPLLEGDEQSWPDPRALLVERSDCLFRGVRLDHHVYFQHGAGPLPTTGLCRPDDVEHYDLDADPYQLENLYPSGRRTPDGALELEMEQLMSDLADCSGIAGRDPLPSGGQHCQ
jgi:N-acetylglucosamine-6-sulfatase